MDRLDELRRLLPPDAVHTDAETLGNYGRDWVRLREPRAAAVAFPSTTEQVQQIVLWARRTKTLLVPSGGRTGLAGGALADAGQVVIACERLDKILGSSPVDRTITAESGVTILRVQQEAARLHLHYPIDFAPADTMQLAGTIATNAGGVHVVRYGMTRQWVAGLIAVTGTGEILDLSLAVSKNNTGYDLKQLFIGSEGTLGIITQATMRLADMPGRISPGASGMHSTSLALLAVPDLQAMTDAGIEARRHGSIFALEFWDAAGMELSLAHLKQPPPHLATAPWYVLGEFEDPAAAGHWSAACRHRALATGALAADSPGAARALWDIRLNIGTAVAPFTPYKNDICIPIAALRPFLESLAGLLGRERSNSRLVVWGHLGDGNLHINCLKPADLTAAAFVTECQRIDDLLYPLVTAHGGSISAEHGIGLLKKHALHFSRSQAEIAAMRGIKKVFDPDNIMNPGKIFD